MITIKDDDEFSQMTKDKLEKIGQCFQDAPVFDVAFYNTQQNRILIVDCLNQI